MDDRLIDRLAGWLSAPIKPQTQIEPLAPPGASSSHPLYRAQSKVIGPDVGVHGWHRAASIAWIWCHYFFSCASLCPTL